MLLERKVFERGSTSSLCPGVSHQVLPRESVVSFRNTSIPFVLPNRRNLFVDETCIDCDTCRWMQGDTFVHKDGKSAVARQPETEVRGLDLITACF